MTLYAVLLERGGSYQKSLPLEGQVDWEYHASFMDALVKDGFVVLGGPLEGSDEVLLIIRAASPEEITARLGQDPWHRKELLDISRILPWTLRLGKLAS